MASNSFKPTKDNVKFIGRTLYQDDTLWVCHTDSGIEYKFNGKFSTIVISPDSIYGSLSKENPARIIVFGDNKVCIDTITTEKTMELKVEFNEVGKHVVRLLKVSEGNKGSIYIKEIKTDSEKIFPSPVKSKKIEFIGDSIMCAFGAMDTEGDFTTKNEDGTKSYAYKVAQKLNADYSIFSYSGYGIYSGLSFTGTRNTDYLVPPLYDKLGKLTWNVEHPENTTLAMTDVEWDHHEFEPDLIVINLGTNDGTFIRTIPDDATREVEKTNFIEEYKNFIKHIRSVHPNANILCCLGIMEQDLCPQVEQAVKEYRNETKDEKTDYFQCKLHDVAKNGIAILFHPNYLSQVDAANELIIEIEKRYGWTTDPTVDISEPRKN